MIGEVISNYKVLSTIGEGGMGTVYLAEHINIGRKAAIKALHNKYLENSNIKERFKNEAATLSQIEHPNIVRLYDYIENTKGLFLIMEYVDGILLDEYIKNESGPINEENAIKIMKGLLLGFAYAHSKNIVHRDVKPNNIIISRDFRTIKILDFGIAKILDDNNRNFTKDGTQMGTVYYMSPEQVRGQTIDRRSDIYSLGITFYQMITGINPYEKITTEYEIYNKITHEELPPAQSIYPYASERIDKIIKKATKKNINDRYQNCEQILLELKDNKKKLSFEETKISEPSPIKTSLKQSQKKGTNTVLILSAIIVIFTVLAFGLYKMLDMEDTATEITDNSTVNSQTYNTGAENTDTKTANKLAESTPGDITKSESGTEIDYVTDKELRNEYGDIFLYTGSVKNDMAEGKGKARYTDKTSNGETYEGDFRENKRDGKGKYIWPNGSYYIGGYKNNTYDGKGVYFDIDNKKIVSGIWKNGVKIE